MKRRRLLLSGAGLLTLGACDLFGDTSPVRSTLEVAEQVTRRVQRALMGHRLAREYTPEDISPTFRSNGTSMPGSAAYRTMMENGFADWRLQVGGLVAAPQSLSLPDLRALPSRTQITRHDCVEGWSAIGQWKGVPLAHVLALARPAPEARFVLFHCADELERTLDGSGRYYESIDLFDADHPQTILAYEMNGATLPVPNGAPLRLRVERQLGYKHAKYLTGIELVASLDGFGRGRGGYWEDRGYEWYAGI